MLMTKYLQQGGREFHTFITLSAKKFLRAVFVVCVQSTKQFSYDAPTESAIPFHAGSPLVTLNLAQLDSKPQRHQGSSRLSSLCTKFGDSGFHHFWLIMRNDRQTDRQTTTGSWINNLLFIYMPNCNNRYTCLGETFLVTRCCQ